MLSRLKILTYNRCCNSCMRVCRKSTNSKAKDAEIKDNKFLYSLFFNTEVQNDLKLLTHIDEAKVFQFRPVGSKISKPFYELLTTEEVEQKKKEARLKMRRLLQMPPVLQPRPEKINEILDDDPTLDGFDLDHSKIVFTDISENTFDEKRVIVVREPNGVLRKAEWDERKRMNQIYFPLPGRQLFTPKMFEDEQLNNLFEKKEYKFILDRACVQFDPDDPEYINVTSKTYDKINENKDFELLHSTRHFGSLTFYLVLHKNIDNMIISNIQAERIQDNFILVSLYNKIHSFTSEKIQKEELFDRYIQSESKNKDILELTWQTYKKNYEALAEEQNLKENTVVV